MPIRSKWGEEEDNNNDSDYNDDNPDSDDDDNDEDTDNDNNNNDSSNDNSINNENNHYSNNSNNNCKDNAVVTTIRVILEACFKSAPYKCLLRQTLELMFFADVVIGVW